METNCVNYRITLHKECHTKVHMARFQLKKNRITKDIQDQGGSLSLSIFPSSSLLFHPNCQEGYFPELPWFDP